MRKALLTCAVTALLFASLACTTSLRSTPTPLPTVILLPSATQPLASPTAAPPTQTLVLPSPTVQMNSPTPAVASATPIPPTAASAVSAITPGSPSGPYAVVLVSPGDTLNIRSGAGLGSPAIGTFPAAAKNVMRTGPSARAGEDGWVQVQNPSGGNGWVNAAFLTEYVDSTAFCADGRVNDLITSLGSALNAGNGELLASLVSPAHGVTVYLWRYGNPVTFTPADARWVFGSTYPHDWGAAPGSGLETSGSFHETVLPRLLDVFSASYTLDCNVPGAAASFSAQPWPAEYANINYYGIYKPGTPGIDLDWRLWLVGVEYVQGKPYVVSLIHFEWEP